MKKRVLYDTNVVLDVLLQRQPHYQASVAALDVVEKQSAIVEGYIAGHAVTTLDYLLRKQVKKSTKQNCFDKTVRKNSGSPGY